MTTTDVKFETRTVHAIRGLESRTIAKLESEGWELVSQQPGRLRTELSFRRPKPKTRWLLWTAGGGGLAAVIAVVIVLGIIGERNTPPAKTPASEQSLASQTPSPSPSVEPSKGDSSQQPENQILTPENNAELAAVLALTDYCDPSIAAFAGAYNGRTISFPGNIQDLTPHGSATTRYDILIGAGDYSQTTGTGPAFQFRDENTTNDLHFIGSVPDTIGIGTNLEVTAQLKAYETNSCLFLLEPVSTTVR
ncbi:DUF4839 domain-containing protein [Agreia pratensis]|uniref:DUF4839 domain-containing protein n=1 Tax=Agreia pratensis TaxID=150121 RepID=UPI001594B61D|nr:DUF4839 domain-containing protein [Agreia pratensis]